MLTDLLIIQPLDFCNLNCSYCYLPGRRDPKVMSKEVLEATFRCVFNSSMVHPLSDSEFLSVSWHSGEPLVAGIDFYRKALETADQYNKNKIKVQQTIQTNATLINQEWCDFFKENQVVATVSLDGPEFLHDKYRKNWNNHGSFKKVMQGVDYLRKNKLHMSAICVLTADSLDYPEQIYQFFKENDFEVVCFNTEDTICHNTNNTLDNQLLEKYRIFIEKLYDLWDKDNRQIWIREFDELLSHLKILKNSGQIFSPSALAFNIVSISKDGDISTFSPELAPGTLEDPKAFVIGNVLTIDSLDEVTDNSKFLQQLAAINKGVARCASECEYFNSCGGGQPSNKFYELGTFEGTETMSCLLRRKINFDVIVNRLLHGRPVTSTETLSLA